MSGIFVDPAPRIRGGALIASITFHLAIFYIYSQMSLPGTRSFSSGHTQSPLRIHAELITPRPIINQPLFEVTDTSPALENIEAPVNNPEIIPRVESAAIPATPETTSNLPPIEDVHAMDAGTDVWITPDTGPQTGAFGNVFDPRVRQRLQHNRMHRSTAKLDAPVETRDAYGDRYVALDNEKCLMAKQSMRPGETTNWYLTSCGGLDDGENMLRRVEQNWRNRRE